MTHRDYLWCALNLLLDGEEKLERLCPDCRTQAEADRCPICGVQASDRGENEGFDQRRFEELRGEAND